MQPLLTLTLIAAAAVNLEAAPSIAKADEHGFVVHELSSPCQSGTTHVRVLLPENAAETRELPVVYVLPVEPRSESRYGDGLLEIKQQNLHNVHRAIFVAPTFSQLPWYADHPSDPVVRQETYFVKVVVPFVEQHYPAISAPQGRLLLV